MIEHKGAQWSARLPRRHPCDVTADRLLNHLEKYPEKFDGSDRDAVAKVRFILHQIVDGDR
jgi:hypothetical protein